MRQLISQSGPGTFDIAFVDADKDNVFDCYGLALQLIRPALWLLTMCFSRVK